MVWRLLASAAVLTVLKMRPGGKEVVVEMERLRELLRRLLGVSAVSADLSEVVSRLFRAVLELEANCPQLVCHLHVSGVSQVTGDSFFVVLHDAALQASRSARRVINSVYTHLHSEGAMALTSAIWLQGQRRASVVPTPSLVPVTTNAPGSGDAATSRPLASAAGAVSEPASGTGAAAVDPASVIDTAAGAEQTCTPVPPSGPPNAVKADQPHKEDASKEPLDARDRPVPTPSPPQGAPFVDPIAVLSSSFTQPDVHVPSELARQQVEALFTLKKNGWARVLRDTLASMRSVLCGHYHLAGRPRLQGMLKWWPIDLNARAEADDSRTEDVPPAGRRARIVQCTPFPYPVLVEGRHLPIRDRVRDKDDMVEQTVEVSCIVPPRSELLYGVVATILLLLDKKPHVRAVVTKTLADNGVVHGNGEQVSASDGEKGSKVTDLFAELRTPSPSPSKRSSASSPSVKNAGGAHEPGSTAVASRLASRQAAAAASRSARDPLAARKARGVEPRTPQKRLGARRASTNKKRARLAASVIDELDSDFIIPSLDPVADVVSCNVVLEAEMVADMTYQMLATNWSVPSTGDRSTDGRVMFAPAERWPAIVAQQVAVDFVLGEQSVLDSRRLMMAKGDELRTRDGILVGKDIPVYIDVTMPSAPVAVPVSLSTLSSMGVLHQASRRLQALRGGVVWLEEVSKAGNARVPVVVGDERESTGTLATSLIQHLLSRKPTDVVWRIGSRTTGGVDEDVVVPAYRVMGDMDAVPMVDDLITVNSIILQRACNAADNNVHIIQCSVFRQVLSAADEDAVARVAEDVDRLAGGATTLAGVCNIGDAHWVAFLLDLSTKTVTRYDSGAHFESLKTQVSAAHLRVREFAKMLGDLAEPSMDEDTDGGTSGGNTTIPTKVKVWSMRRLNSPSQDDTCSCGPFAFAFVWHATLGKKSRLQTGDGSAMRLEMLAAVVADGADAASEPERDTRPPFIAEDFR